MNSVSMTTNGSGKKSQNPKLLQNSWWTFLIIHMESLKNSRTTHTLMAKTHGKDSWQSREILIRCKTKCHSFEADDLMLCNKYTTAFTLIVALISRVLVRCFACQCYNRSKVRFIHKYPHTNTQMHMWNASKHKEKETKRSATSAQMEIDGAKCRN